MMYADDNKFKPLSKIPVLRFEDGKEFPIRCLEFTNKCFLDPNLDIDRVIVNGPATVVFWNDGTKTVVKCAEDETWDDEKAIAMAVLKRLYGNKGAYFDLIRKGVEKLNEDLDIVSKGVERFGSNVNHLDLDATQLDLGSLTDVVNRLWDGLQ